jgi:hypothetical protein
MPPRNKIYPQETWGKPTKTREDGMAKSKDIAASITTMATPATGISIRHRARDDATGLAFHFNDEFKIGRPLKQEMRLSRAAAP